MATSRLLFWLKTSKYMCYILNMPLEHYFSNYSRIFLGNGRVHFEQSIRCRSCNSPKMNSITDFSRYFGMFRTVIVILALHRHEKTINKSAEFCTEAYLHYIKFFASYKHFFKSNWTLASTLELFRFF